MNINNVKAAMFDMDGTLINRKLEMSENTKYTLRRLKEKGVVVTTNTGRPSVICKRLLNNCGVLEYFDYIYGCNGNEVVDLKNGDRSFVKPLKKETLVNLDKYFTENYLSICYYSDDSKILYYNHKIDDEKLFQEWNEMRITTPQQGDFGGSDVFLPKAIVLFKPEHYDELKKKIENFPDKSVHIIRSGIDCMEISPVGISKGSAVDHLANKLSITNDEIMCFGDEESDVLALNNCFGVMVGGQEKALQYGVKYFTGDVYDDGVYKFLKESDFI